MMRDLRRTGLCLLLVCAVSPAVAADWGTIKGKFVFDGDAPTPAKINVTKDVEYCGNHNLVDETIVTGDGGALANVVVYIYTARGKTVDVNPAYEATAKDKITIDNKGCRFEPHIIAVRTSQQFEVHNSDPGIGHNTNAGFVANPKFNEMVTNDAPVLKTLEKPEPQPAPVSCNVHPWMKGFVVVRDDPYVAISDLKGDFEIKDIPAGTHEFIFWHESKGFLRDVEVGGKKTDRRGRVKLDIKAGEPLDLGTVKIPPKALGK